MDKTLKTVIIINDFNYIQGGASKIAIDTANILIKEHYKVYFFSCSKEKSKELDDNIIDLFTGQGAALDNKSKIRGILFDLYNKKAAKELSKLLDELNPNETIIHVHGWTKGLSSSIFKVIFKKNYKMVLTLHDYFTVCPNGGFYNYKKDKICNYSPLSCKCMCCNCDSRNRMFKVYRIIRQFVQNKIIKLPKKLEYAISISNMNEEILKKYLPSAKIKRIYNPVDYPKSFENNLSKKDIYLYVGRLDKEKGVDDFCESISELNLNGLVIGSGNELQRLKDKYSNINFVGWKTKEEIISYLDNAKALIFPSKWYETAGLTILEAQFRGVFCFVRSTCAGKEFISEGDNGALFSDLEDLKVKIKKYKNIKNINFKDFRKYSKNNYCVSLVDYYKEIIGGM